MCALHLCVAGRILVCAAPSLRYVSMLLGREASKQATTPNNSKKSKKKKKNNNNNSSSSLTSLVNLVCEGRGL